MSKFVLLSDLETAHAAAHGWLLVDVYDLTKRALRPQILPTAFTPPARNTEATFRRVFEAARNGDKTSLRALQLISQLNKERRV